MKNILFKLILSCISVSLLTGCMDEVMPTEYASKDQVGVSESALEAMANGTAALMYSYNYFETFSAQEFGYPAMMTLRDAMTDCPYVSTTYNHFSNPWGSLADFSSSRGKQPWRYYYRMILNANSTISLIKNPEEVSDKAQQLYANALVYRALAYIDLFRMYEYKKTGVPALDASAEKDKIGELTTVIIDENFVEADAYNNPRVPFYQMYRFVMNDLNEAEKYLGNYSRTDKTKADLSVVQSYKARLWLEIATRFQKHPDDLQTQLAHEDDAQLAKHDKLGITSANDCYKKAAEYARNAMSGYTPLSEEQWHSKTNGFNDASVNSWIFAITITSPDAVYNRVNNFQSFAVTEYSRGYGRSQYHCYRMIDKNLYDKIDDMDWRKETWIDPADKGKNPTPGKYHTLLSDKEWALRDAYVGFKFRPNNGDISDDYKNALQVAFPVIRVEEMYFIEAEAKAYTDGLASGVGALTSFLNSHRYTDNSYSISPSSVDDFVDNYLITQKRIELWGEGLSFFDIKRREIALTRGYKGTNWLPSNRFNSRQGYAASWMNLYIPNEGEASLNHAIIMNPDPAVLDSYGLWVDN